MKKNWKLQSKQFVSIGANLHTLVENTKNAVIAKLIAWGNNEEAVKDMVEKHFKYAFEHYATVKTIAECIRTMY